MILREIAKVGPIQSSLMPKNKELLKKMIMSTPNSLLKSLAFSRKSREFNLIMRMAKRKNCLKPMIWQLSKESWKRWEEFQTRIRTILLIWVLKLQLICQSNMVFKENRHLILLSTKIAMYHLMVKVISSCLLNEKIINSPMKLVKITQNLLTKRTSIQTYFKLNKNN